MHAPSHSPQNKRFKHYKRGLMAEHIAAWHLRARGWRIICTRFKTPLGEIDVIAKRGRTLAFVEVKARAHKDAAAESIHKQNQQRVIRAAQWFIASHPNYAECNVRFDACLVPWYSWPQFITHAFSEN